MRRSVIVFAVILIMAVAFGLYRMEYQIRDMEQRLAQVNREVLQSHQAIQVLHAEWSYLVQPARLQKIADSHLQLVPLLPSQIGLINDIPFKDPAQIYGDFIDFRGFFASPSLRLPQNTTDDPGKKGKS